MLATEHTLDPKALYTINAAGFSATADAFARDPHSQGLWFLSMVGSQTALKAIWASLLKQPPDVAHLIQGADGMALSGGYERCGIPYGTDRHVDDQDRQAAGEWGLARVGLHQARRIRLGERPVPSPGSDGEGSAGHPLPLPGQEEPTAVAPLLGRLAVGDGAFRRKRPPNSNRREWSPTAATPTPNPSRRTSPRPSPRGR